MNTNGTVCHRSIAATRRRKARALYFGLCALGIAVTASAAQKLQIITFDAPGAGTGKYQGTGCFAYTDCSVLINNSGTITGYYLDANNVYHGFVRGPDGKFASFDAPGADTTPQDFNGTLPNAINDAGAIAGSYVDVENNEHAFLRSPDGKFYTTIDPPGSLGTAGIALNLEGAVVGYYLDQNVVFQGYVRRPDGTFATWLGPAGCDTPPATGCYGTAAFGINVFGSISGGYEDNSGNFVGHGLVRSPEGRFTTYNVPDGGNGPYQGTNCPGCSVPFNLFGAIAGYYIDASNATHGYLRNPWGGITTFDAPGEGPAGVNCTADCPIGLNDWGAITGTYLDANNVYHGFLRSPDGKFIIIDAPGADMTPQDFNGTFAVSINDQGAITGYYIDAKNVAHGFVAFPAEGP
jgi:hypothetical protein